VVSEPPSNYGVSADWTAVVPVIAVPEACVRVCVRERQREGEKNAEVLRSLDVYTDSVNRKEAPHWFLGKQISARV